MNYLVCFNGNNPTHFTKDDSGYWSCTHGGWGGKLTENSDGSCAVAGVKFKSYQFTTARSFDEALDIGVIAIY